MNVLHRRPRLPLFVASLVLATLALFASEAWAGSFGSEPPDAILMKYKTVLQTARAAGGTWCVYAPPAGGGPGGYPCAIYDNFGVFDFPKVDEVGAGKRLHVRFHKPEPPTSSR